MTASRVDRIRGLLKGIETGDPQAVSVVSASKYIQHNPQTDTGREGLAALFARLSKTSPKVNIVRAFSDGDYVFGHTEYDFDTRRIGFEVFRFEGESTVEHWDNIQPREGPNASGHSMVDGPTHATDLDKTEANRVLVRQFVEQVRIGRDVEGLAAFISDDRYTEHAPNGVDGSENLTSLIEKSANDPEASVYHRLHRVLAHGSFALAVSEGERAGVHTSFYDLYRIEANRIVEHWDTVEAVAPPEQWMNDNGKF